MIFLILTDSMRSRHSLSFACLSFILDYGSQATLVSKFHWVIALIVIHHSALGLEGGGGGKVGNDGFNLPTF